MLVTIMSDVDTIRLHDRFDDPDDAWCIKKDGTSGLFGSPTVREDPEDMPQADGGYWPSRLTQKPRSVSLDCVIRGCSSVDAAIARDRINDLICRPLKLLVETAAGRWWLSGYLAGDPEPMMRWHERGFEFGLVITCPDPLKYGDPVTFSVSGGSLSVVNSGRVPSWPSVHVNGAVAGFTLSYAGHSVSWEGDWTGDVDLDLRDMLPSRGRIAWDDPFRVPPGESVVTGSRSDGGVLPPSTSLVPSTDLVLPSASLDFTVTVSPAWR